MSDPNALDRTKDGHTRWRAIVIDCNHDDLVLVTKSLLATGEVDVIAETTSQSLASSLVERHKPNFVFISADNDNGPVIDLINKIHKSTSTARIIATGAQIDAQKILQCFRAGSDEFLQKPLKSDEIISVLDRLKIHFQVQPIAQHKAMGQIIALCGSRGGCGTTTLACNTAYMLSQKHSTILVDFNFAQGDLSVYFDLHPNYSLMEVSGTEDRLDETLIESITLKHESGLHFLLQPTNSQPISLSDEEIRRLVSVLQVHYKFILLDIGHNEMTISRIAPYMNHFFLIINQNLPSIYLANRKLRLLNTLEINPNDISLVVNAYNKQSDLNLSRITKALERSDLICIRHDEANVIAAMNQGVPLYKISPRGIATKDISQLTEKMNKLYSEEPGQSTMDRQPVKTSRGLFPFNLFGSTIGSKS